MLIGSSIIIRLCVLKSTGPNLGGWVMNNVSPQNCVVISLGEI